MMSDTMGRMVPTMVQHGQSKMSHMVSVKVSGVFPWPVNE